jgi:hypothetical protein
VLDLRRAQARTRGVVGVNDAHSGPVLQQLDAHAVGLVEALTAAEQHTRDHLAALEHQRDENARLRQALARQERTVRAALGRLRHLHETGKLEQRHFAEALAILLPNAEGHTP